MSARCQRNSDQESATGTNDDQPTKREAAGQDRCGVQEATGARPVPLITREALYQLS